jgi:hypothetical protein
VEALIKEKKEKENVLTHLELVNSKNAYVLISEKFKRKTTKAKKKWWKKRSIRGIYNNCKHSWRLHKSRGRV